MESHDQAMRMTPPGSDGRHPEHGHLIFIDVEPHHGMYIVKTPATEGTMLVDWSDLDSMLGGQFDPDSGEQWGYASDEYLEYFQTEEAATQ